MPYKIKSTKVDGANFGVEVDYTLNGKIVNAHVDIFMPKSKADVITAIESREETEQTRLDATILNEAIKVIIDADIANDK